MADNQKQYILNEKFVISPPWLITRNDVFLEENRLLAHPDW